ncbi:hypothetical protein L7F22_038957 [Adiantum nelumboides]|nr:hypothetical protein [Adiantum nelumboides]
MRIRKTDALSAMNGGEYASTSATDINPPLPQQHPSHKPLGSLASMMAPLPLFGEDSEKKDEPKCIPTQYNTPRYPPSRQRERLFDLEEAPTFYPTVEEFSDPLRYIKWVGEPEGGNGKAFGIVKIVPPEGWNPPFVLDQERFRFRTRVQKLNSLSADARASQNYLEQLQKFHAQQGHARVSIPIVDRKPVDLYQLKLVVSANGGYDSVARQRKWAEVTRKVGYEEKDSGHLAGQIKAAYSRIIYPYERFLELNKENAKRPSTNEDERNGTSEGAASPSAAALAKSVQENHRSGSTEDKGVTDNSRRRSSRRKTDPSDAPVVVSQRRRLREQQPTPPPAGTSGDFYLAPGAEEQMCEICLRGDDGMSMLLCDECNRGYHMYCLDPPLTSIPKSEWYCPPCLVGTGNDYGFDDGETHSLFSFWKRAEEFRSQWWTKYAAKDAIWTAPDGKSNGVTRAIPETDLKISEDDVEREFWRLVHSPDETVEVEYGADVHSTTHGSALPTLETHPLSPYARDGWNLNNLPILNGSLLRYIKSDISGMTVPWVYVGMMFSTFCWHNEDHYTYSINYQHFGDTKTWYGVPGSDAYKLEDALRKAAPDLFEQSPDLLFQLVTMMSPDKLQKEGVNVYAVDQRANEFVITYPKAYHSGFNQGFNLNEAVNFALPDWIELDLECVRRYQQFNRFPVFSHDELVVTAFQHNQGVDTAVWLQSSMREMVEREIKKREKIRESIADIREILDETDQPELEYQCSHCNLFCYLGQLYCNKSEGVACLDHGEEVCADQPKSKWTLRLRYSDDQLRTMLEKTIERASIPSNWQARLHKLITTHVRPPLRSLRGLLHEGEKISFLLDDLENLKEFVEKANKWVDEATPLIARRHQRRSNVGVSQRNTAKRISSRTATDEDEIMNVANEDENESLATSEDVFRMVREAEKLPFDAPEIQAIQAISQQVHDFIYDARSLLKKLSLHSYDSKEQTATKERKDLISKCEELINSGLSLNVQLPYMDDLQRHVGRENWIKEAESMTNTFTDLEDVEAFIADGLSYGISRNDEMMQTLCEIRDKGLEWKRNGEEMLKPVTQKTKWPCKYTISDVEKAVLAPASVSVVPGLLVKLQSLQKQIKDASKSCITALTTLGERKREKSEAEREGRFTSMDPLSMAIEDAKNALEASGMINVVAEREEDLQLLIEECIRRPIIPMRHEQQQSYSHPPPPPHGRTLQQTPYEAHTYGSSHQPHVHHDYPPTSYRPSHHHSPPLPLHARGPPSPPPIHPQHSYPPSMGFGRPPAAAPIQYDMHDDPNRSYMQMMGEASSQANNSGDESGMRGGDDKKRKRGKRARFVFEEEVGIFVPVNGERVFCLCRRGETAEMISCDRCALWFHTACIHVKSAADLGGERWICPMCCVKTERRYPFAEVKVKEMNVTDPNLWLDVRATLRSTRLPVSKLQHWTVDEDRRIVLHLESFLPATLPSKGDRGDDAKRHRTDEGDGFGGHGRSGSHGSATSSSAMANALGSVSKMPSWNDVRARVTPLHRTPNAEEHAARLRKEAEERHRQGMQNLYSRGVSDAMIQKWFIGWNGKELVYPRYDRNAVYHELPLGPRIVLDKDDLDGTRYMHAMLDRDAEERIKRGEPPIVAAAPAAALPPPSQPTSASASSSSRAPVLPNNRPESAQIHALQPKPSSNVNVEVSRRIPSTASPTVAPSNLHRGTASKEYRNSTPPSNAVLKTEIKDGNRATPPTAKSAINKSIFSVSAIPPFRGSKSSASPSPQATPPSKDNKVVSDIDKRSGSASISSSPAANANVAAVPPPLPRANRDRTTSMNDREIADQGLNKSSVVQQYPPKPIGQMQNKSGIDSRYEPISQSPLPSHQVRSTSGAPSSHVAHQHPASGPARQYPPQHARSSVHSNSSPHSSPYGSVRHLPPPPPPSIPMRSNGEERGGRPYTNYSPSPRQMAMPHPSAGGSYISPRMDTRREIPTSSTPNAYNSSLSGQHRSPREYYRDHPGSTSGRISPPMSARHPLGLHAQDEVRQRSNPPTVRGSPLIGGGRSSVSPRLSNIYSANIYSGNSGISGEDQQINRSPSASQYSQASSSPAPKEKKSLAEMRLLARRMRPNATDEEIEEMANFAMK